MFEYDVFISFASSDEEIVKPIWQELTLSGLRVFWSDAVLREKLGESWFEVIQSSLERSRHFLLIVSSASISSKWVKREYTAFYNHCYKAGIRKLIPVLTNGYQVSSLPLFLRELEACRLDDTDTIRRVVQILGGTDVEELKKELLLKTEENEKLAESVRYLESKLTVIGQEQVTLKSGQVSLKEITPPFIPKKIVSKVTAQPESMLYVISTGCGESISLYSLPSYPNVTNSYQLDTLIPGVAGEVLETTKDENQYKYSSKRK